MTRVLVAAASRHGATLEIAGAITEALGRRGLDAHMLGVEEVKGLATYDAVVLGSSVYFGH